MNTLKTKNFNPSTAGEIGCLLVHGFGGARFEMQNIAKNLEQAGIRTVTPLLPGHGTNIDDFQKTFFEDWYQKAEEEYLKLRGEVNFIGVVGFSMGGALSLLIAARHSPDAVVSISAPVSGFWEMLIQRRDPRILLLPLLKYIKPVIYHSGPKPESLAIAPVEGYDEFISVPQALSLGPGFKEVKKSLAKVKAPILVFNDLHDRQVSADNALRIARNVSSELVEIHLTHIKEKITSRHMLPTHIETKYFVAEKTRDFILRMKQGAG